MPRRLLSRMPRSPLYRMNAYGFTSPWLVWQLQRGALDDWCAACRGTGVRVLRPCACLEGMSSFASRACACGQDGCTHCRRKCWDCNGRRIVRGDAIRAEDFGDEESLAIARALMPDLEPDSRKRSDMNAELGE